MAQLAPFKPTQEPTEQNGWWDKISQYLFGSSAYKASTLTEPQQQGQYELLQQLGPLLQSIGTKPQNNFQDIANAETLKFNTQTIPSLAERFASQGAGGQRSSDFIGMLGAANAGLHSNLASLGAQYGMNQRGQNIDLFRSLLSSGMSPSLSYVDRRAGVPEEMAKAALPILGAWATGGTSAMAGNSLTNYLSQTNQGRQNSMVQQQMGGTNDYINNILSNRPMNTQDFFRSSGIARG